MADIKMQKIVLLLTWWTTPHEEMEQEWKEFTDNRDIPLEESSILTYFAWIINGIDDKHLNWSAFASFASAVSAAIGTPTPEIVGEQPKG